ncbi:MAG TPA: MurR/RpiR family transcriptional regulator [Rhodobacterales bacterium]|nr:MurR/RpiR family transcriptional regulator [Rhodobacterales bacterium]
MDPTLRARIIARLKDEISHLAPQMHAAAKYVVDHPAAFGLDPIRATARKAGVSTYTLVNMAKHMGFSSFESFRAPFRNALLANTPEAANPGWLDDARASGGGGAAFAEAAKNARAIVLHSLEDQQLAAMAAVVDTLLAAPNVYVTGMRASYAMAYYLHYVGRMALPGMELIPRNMSSAIDDLSDASQGDVLVAMTVTPYSRETIEACAFAQSKGLKLILISDSQIVSPMLKPDHVLVASMQSTHHFACYSGMTALIEALIAMLMHRGDAPARARIESYEHLRETSQAYWSETKT